MISLVTINKGGVIKTENIKKKTDKSSMTTKEKEQGLQYLREQHSHIQSKSNQQMSYRNPAVSFIMMLIMGLM